MRKLIGLVTGLGLVGLGVSGAAAQTAQRFSVQGSGLYANLFGSGFTNVERGLGGEVQLRITPGALSLGAGFQYTDHRTSGVGSENSDFRLYGGFLEPRYVIDAGSNTVAPYVSTRFSILSQKITDPDGETSATGVTLNGGGGVLIRLASRVNLDVGSTFGYTHFGELKQAGSPIPNTSVSGSNIVVRIGLAFGIGG